ncbi:methyltransferase family protein [Balneicella halophila]|uniref:Methyltransferase family protein n=1 Tax=Balneicella halophila TaxID=1537566 RepID=A0A7L4UML8_BALHA|nr:class I SAM-dependent methyltransferase [Balneicella halophila]PVX49866.1 methyltransferase family protein [Balneicella halophila]
MSLNDSNKFYATIAQYYEYIFPLKEMKLRFAKEHITSNSNVLDVGCATGAFSIALSEHCQDIKAFDLSEDMIEIAKSKLNSKVGFAIGNMLEIERDYSEKKFDVITCFGNTLVHLLSEKKIQSFLKQTHQLLSKDGVLLLQILNYDYILDNNVNALPKIDNEQICFKRVYEFKEDNRLIDFNTELIVKDENKIVKNSSLLYAIRPFELKNLLVEAGFLRVEMYSSFKKDRLDNKKLPLVIQAFRNN